MKIQSLAIIFIIIIIPISLVLSEYLNTQIETKQNEQIYDRKLLNSTYDAIKAYQLNTVNNAFGDVTTKKVDDVEAAANTFFNSLTSNFNYTGYNSDVMKEYVPAIVFTMYDGYYVYAPFKNVLTAVGIDDYDKSFSTNGGTQVGLKPYVYYNSRYVRGTEDDFIITYSLDNYITIQGVVNGDYHYDYGYIYRIAENKPDADSYGGIYKIDDNTYYYEGCEISNTDTEELREFVGNEQFSYVKINGKKYYLDPDYYSGRGTVTVTGYNVPDFQINADAGIFFIDEKGEKNYNQIPKGYDSNNTKEENKTFLQYYLAITKNKSAYEYFKDSYEFSKAVFGDPVDNYKDKGYREVKTSGYNLKNLNSRDSFIYQNWDSSAKDITNIKDYGEFNIFDGNIERASSNFEQHRKSIIRYVIETNLSTAIASFSSGVSDKTDFIMPKISETDWETIENDVCAISFLQGMSIGSKKYNGYSVVANNLTKEYIDENDIYILAKDNVSGNNIYCKPHDRNLFSNYTMQQKNGTTNYYPGIWKLNFETRQDASVEGAETVVYKPLSCYEGTARVGYVGCYTSIMGSSGINYGASECPDMYSYMDSTSNDKLRKAYYVGLARERKGAFNINNVNYELYEGNNNQYFLRPYLDDGESLAGGNDPGSGGNVPAVPVVPVVPDDDSISAEDINSNDYGTYVEYPIDINGDGLYKDDWMLFYKDNSERVFLIAADYVQVNSRLKPGQGDSSPTLSSIATNKLQAGIGGEYNVYWEDSVENQYTSDKYDKFKLNLFQYNTSFALNRNTKINLKCASTLLNTDNWGGFVDNRYAEYAIGGSTLDMWANSWNAKAVEGHESDYPELRCSVNIGGNYREGFEISLSRGDHEASTRGSLDLRRGCILEDWALRSIIFCARTKERSRRV